MATVTKPIALDESFNTTETPSRNIADVLASLGDAISQGAQPVTKKLATNSFKTINGGLVDGLTVQFAPVQDLHGYDKPWAGGAGKNLLPFISIANVKANNTNGTWSGDIYTYNGITYELKFDADGNFIGVLINGITTQNYTDFSLYQQFGVSINPFVSAGNYTISSNSNDIDVVSGYANTSLIRTTGPASGNCSDGLSWAFFRVAKNVTFTNFLVQPMVRLSSIADPTFEPHTNKCSISGHTQVQSKINDTTNTTLLGGTCFNGQVDQVPGDGDNDCDSVTLVGTEGITWTFNNQTNFQGVYANMSSVFTGEKTSAGYQSKALFSIFKAITRPQDITPGTAYIDTGWLNMIFPVGTFSTSAEVNAWLASNNLQVVYELATPTTLTLTGQNITAEVGENNVSAPMAGQSIKTDSVIYKDMFTWEDVLKVI